MMGNFPKQADFPGAVVKSEMIIMGQKMMTELVSATEKPISAEEFKDLKGYQEMKP